jgi:hypothetical protein
MLNLTKRQLICFGGGALIGVPLFFLLKGSVGNSFAVIVMILVMLPFFLFAMYERNGQPLENVLRNVIQTLFIRPKERPYQTNNLYVALMRQHQVEKEIKQIVRKTKA